MNLLLYSAAALTLLIGLAHSVLGERYILRRLFRREAQLPRLLGGTQFTRQTLRFAWHITSLAWWGFGLLLLQLSRPDFGARDALATIALTFAASGAMALLASRGRHLSWLVFFAIAALAGLAAQSLPAHA